MKTKKYLTKVILVGLLVVAAVVGNFAINSVWAARSQGGGTAITGLSEVEAEMLTYMREEEKMARDVYLLMYNNWGATVFSRIAESEQTHMDTMKKKLDKYSLPDPAFSSEGLFTNEDIQAKYDGLIIDGALSYVGGLYVGATVEEIDMIDIQYAIDITSHIDVINAYQNLLEGSKNHLRAFVGSLKAQGITYFPQYISQELFDAIMELQ